MLVFDAYQFSGEGLIFAESAANWITYFGNSNLGGKLIVAILIFISIFAWTVMIGKYLELSKIARLNNAFKHKMSREKLVLYSQQRELPHVPYSKLFHHALDAFHRLGEDRGRGETKDSNAMRVSHMSNAIERSVNDILKLYEARMVPLATIVTVAPFLGLLGTVWGVMDAFGSVALQANVTLQMLAPGVSGALLTTVAGLTVAIPSVFGYNILLAKNRDLTRDLENFGSSLSDRIELEYQQQYGQDV